jgi:hypothetical protein
MKRLHLLIGPSLFLVAELMLPNGSADPTTRIRIVQTNGLAWGLGHQLIAMAFVFLLIWLSEIYAFLRTGNELTAYLGVLLSTFALAADYGVGILQLLTLDLVRTAPADQAQSVLALIGQSSNLLGFAFLPTLGFAVGFGLLALGYYRRTRQMLPASLLGLAGLLIALASLMQLKPVFILGALALFGFAVLFHTTKK